MQPSTFYFTFSEVLPIEGNFSIDHISLTDDGNYLHLTLIPETPSARHVFSFLFVEIDLMNRLITEIEGEHYEGYLISEIKLSPTDTQYILSLIPTELPGGG